MGLGAYAMIFARQRARQGHVHSVPISAMIVAVLAVPMGLVAFRLRGSYFAIGTWVLAEVASKVIITRKSLGVGDGVSLKVTGHSVASRQDVTYWMAMGTGIGAVLLAYLVLRSRLGLQMQAIRDDEGGARGPRCQRVPHALRDLDRRRVLDRPGRRSVLPPAVASAARRHRRGLQRGVVDGADHLHRRHRRDWHHRGPDHRRRAVLLPARSIPGSPNRVPDLDGRRRPRRRPVLQGGSGARSVAGSASTSSPSAAASSSTAASAA